MDWLTAKTPQTQTRYPIPGVEGGVEGGVMCGGGCGAPTLCHDSNVWQCGIPIEAKKANKPNCRGSQYSKMLRSWTWII